MLGRDQPGIDLEPALLDREVVVATAEPDAAHLHHTQAPTLGTVVDGELLQHDDPVGDRMQLDVVLLGREIVEEDDGAPTLREEVFQREHLPAIAQRVLRQEPELRKAVEHDPGRIDRADMVEDELGGFAKLHLGGVQDGELEIRVERRFRRDELENIDLIERPAMTSGDELQLLKRFRERDEEDPLALACTFQQELQGDRGFAGAGPALVEVHPVTIETAAQDVVEGRTSGRDPRRIVLVRLVGEVFGEAHDCTCIVVSRLRSS